MSLKAFGSAGNGQLGLGEEESSKSKVPVVDIPLQKIANIAGGYFHSIGCTDEGLAYSTGRNDSRQLGRGGNEHKWKRIDALETASIVDVAAGVDYRLAQCAMHCTDECNWTPD
eukprot:TRINITY_DN9537_c0_g1_i1.p3 TRINITY_DN9537_c0_g1~~TRINITY_DN9537_c0_g1_i1.p3  ORF type:complete len:114 (+),score=13.04 TRINITY_DN9537_c0_g1_i1:2674-3015(+)